MLDDYDRKLLALVQVDSARTALELARDIGLSPSAVQRRLNRLKSEGAIQREVALVDPKVLGYNFMAIVEVRLESHRTDSIERFARSVKNVPEILQCHYVTGEADLILLVVARDMEHYSALTADLFDDRDRRVRSFTTNVVIATKKNASSLPAV